MLPFNSLGNCLPPEALQSYARGALQGQAALDCEEHLDQCSLCQSNLAALFESGQRPDWFTSRLAGASNATHAVHSKDSTLRTTDNATTADAVVPRAAVAHLLWQQQATPTRLPESLQANITQPLGRYRIVSLLGSGGFGYVYLARDEKLMRHVALKVPHFSQSDSQVQWNLMLAEAQTVAALDHPAIVPIFDVAATDEVPMFLVSKLIDGQTLAEYMDHPECSPIQAARLIIRVAEALDYAHQRGVIHRDIKPQNILLDRAGKVYLADFGLAWRTADLSRNYPRAGTPFYMSPEQLRGQSQTIDARSDVYSLARVLQQILGGFDHLRDQSLAGPSSPGAPALRSVGELSMIDEAMPLAPMLCWPDKVPERLRQICAKATALEPAQRFQSAAELARALQRFVDSQTPFLQRYRRLLISIAVCLVTCFLMLTLIRIGQTRTTERRAAEQAVEALLESDASNLAMRARAPALSSTWAGPLLKAASHEYDYDKRLRARLALMPIDETLVAAVAEDMLDSPVELTRALIPFLKPYASQLNPSMWQSLQSDPLANRRLNAASYLATADEQNAHWQDPELVDRLLRDLIGDSVSDIDHRVDSLLGQRQYVLPAVRRGLNASLGEVSPTDRLHLISVWERLVRDDLRASIDLMINGPPSVYTKILRRLNAEDPQTIEILREWVRVDKPFIPNSSSPSLGHRHLAAMALLKLGHEEFYWPMWRSQSDPSHLAIQVSLVGFGPLSKDRLIARLKQTDGLKPVQSLPDDMGARIFRADLSERRNLLLGVTAGHVKKSMEKEPDLLEQMKELYRHDADPCVHGLTRRVFALVGQEPPDLDSTTRSVDHNGAWFVNSLGETMVIVLPCTNTPYRYAVASCEVQRRHFEQFLSESNHRWPGQRLGSHDEAAQVDQVSDRCCAQIGMSWYDAAAYCNWLSLREGLDECYLPNADGQYAQGMRIKANALQLNGYRLPTDEEWEHAGRSGVTTNLHFGDLVFAMHDYIWDLSTARGVAQSVGRLRPNYLGLFDIHGNASEWTMHVNANSEQPHEIRDDQVFEHRGGSVVSRSASDVYFRARERSAPHDRSQPTGLRVVRTLSAQP